MSDEQIANLNVLVNELEHLNDFTGDMIASFGRHCQHRGQVVDYIARVRHFADMLEKLDREAGGEADATT